MISQTAEYALRSVVFLATNHETSNSRRDIAEQTQVPHDYLTKVLQVLGRAGIVTAQRGPGGGYRLSVPPDSLTVYDVVTAISSLPRIEKCPLGIDAHKMLCPLHRRLDDATAKVERAFRDTTIAELIPVEKSNTCRFPRGR